MRDKRHSRDTLLLRNINKTTTLDEVETMLATDRRNLNVRGYKGYTPLILAYTLGHIEIANLLILKGADTNVIDNQGWTPLMHCLGVKTQVREDVELLIEHGAGKTLDIINNQDFTALMKACKSSDLSTVIYLVEECEAKYQLIELGSGEYVFGQNLNGLTLLDFAKQNEEDFRGSIYKYLNTLLT